MTEHMHSPRRMSIMLMMIVVPVLASACGGDDSTAPVGAGSVVVTIASRAGTAPSVRITGPGGFSRTVTSTTTLQHLADGSYTIHADSIVTENAVVGYAVDTAVVVGSPFVVNGSSTSLANVSFALGTTHGALWTTSTISNSLSAFAASLLDSTGPALPALTLGGVGRSVGVAIDAGGNMWVSTVASDTLRMYTVAQRSSGGSPLPAVTVVSPAVVDPLQLAFDGHGNLWVADFTSGVLCFSSAQLAAGGSAIEPSITITDGSFPNSGPISVAFDSAGNAWVLETLANSVVKYSHSMLGSSGSPVPTVRIGTPPEEPLPARSSTRDHPTIRSAGDIPPNAYADNFYEAISLAFDAHGELWVANEGGQNLRAYAPSLLAASGDPEPTVTIPFEAVYPVGLAFDKSGTLWFSDAGTSNILGLSLRDQSASATPSDAIVLLAGLQAVSEPYQIAFDEWVVVSSPAR